MQLVQVVVEGRFKEPPPTILVMRVVASVKLNVPVVTWMFVKVSVTHEVLVVVLWVRDK